jgi:hypothetical protein
MSRSKIYDAIERRQIPALRIAGQLRIPMAEIQKIIAQQLQPETPEFPLDSEARP